MGKKKNKKFLIFKVDFEKAYDSISWVYLDQIMGFMGFGDRWRSWIHGLLKNARSSILVNGSPTEEFNLLRGLRQGDLISHFLFLIAMEGLHIVMEDAVASGNFRGVEIEKANLEISHLFMPMMLYFWVNGRRVMLEGLSPSLVVFIWFWV